MAFKIRLSENLPRTHLYFRLTDSARQTHAQSVMFSPTGEWSVVEFDFSKKAFHWGGPNDGVLRLPSVNCSLSVEPGRPVGNGHLDVADVIAVTSASEDAIPSIVLKCVPDRQGAVYFPDEEPEFRLVVSYRNKADGRKFNYVNCKVFDWLNREVSRHRIPPRTLRLKPSDLSGRFGAFRLSASLDRDITNEYWFARLTSKTVKPCSWVGTQCHFHGWRNPPCLTDMIAAAGIGIVRDEPLWSCCERTHGVFAPPAGFDGFVDALNARGIRMNLTLTYENKIYDNPLDPVAFAKFAGWAARHYKGRINRFEIWNEPHNFYFKKRYWEKSHSDIGWVKKFVEFTKMADDAIRKEHPQAVVAVTAEDVPFLLRMMVTNGIARAHNAISFHPYCHDQPRPEREFFLKDFGDGFRKLARAHGGADRWCVTEAGWTTFAGKGEYWKVAGYYPRASLDGQAKYIVRMYLAALQAGCEYAIQYDFRDDGPRREYTEHNFGLVHLNYTPKPSYAAVAFLTRYVGQLKYAGDVSLQKDQYRVAQFESGLGKDGGKVFVAWSIEGEKEWTLPDSCGRPTECRDIMGNVIAAPFTRNRVLKLTEYPVYLKFGNAK